MIPFKNTKKQGDMGLGSAIFYFTNIGQTVSIPLTDSQDYDLVVDVDNSLKKVQIKSCNFKRKYYEVNLSIKGGNRTSIGTIKRFNNSNCDYLFIIINQSEKYLIPTKELSAKCNLVLGPKYQKYLVK
jgi:hypothetical protein